MFRRVILALVVLVGLTVMAVPSLSAAAPAPEYFYPDVCSNAIGCSWPGPGTPGGCNDNKVDCCSKFQLCHVHDLGANLGYKALFLTHTPGWVNGCTDVAKAWVKGPPCDCRPTGWVLVGAWDTRSRWIQPGQWKSYHQLIRNPNGGQPFQCVKIEISNTPGYNDGSMAVGVR
jgi:hypothetical protein